MLYLEDDYVEVAFCENPRNLDLKDTLVNWYHGRVTGTSCLGDAIIIEVAILLEEVEVINIVKAHGSEHIRPAAPTELKFSSWQQVKVGQTVDINKDFKIAPGLVKHVYLDGALVQMAGDEQEVVHVTCLDNIRAGYSWSDDTWLKRPTPEDLLREESIQQEEDSFSASIPYEVPYLAPKTGREFRLASTTMAKRAAKQMTSAADHVAMLQDRMRRMREALNNPRAACANAYCAACDAPADSAADAVWTATRRRCSYAKAQIGDIEGLLKEHMTFMEMTQSRPLRQAAPAAAGAAAVGGVGSAGASAGEAPAAGITGAGLFAGSSGAARQSLQDSSEATKESLPSGGVPAGFGQGGAAAEAAAPPTLAIVKAPTAGAAPAGSGGNKRRRMDAPGGGGGGAEPATDMTRDAVTDRAMAVFMSQSHRVQDPLTGNWVEVTAEMVRSWVKHSEACRAGL